MFSLSGKAIVQEEAQWRQALAQVGWHLNSKVWQAEVLAKQYKAQGSTQLNASQTSTIIAPIQMDNKAFVDNYNGGIVEWLDNKDGDNRVG